MDQEISLGQEIAGQPLRFHLAKSASRVPSPRKEAADPYSAGNESPSKGKKIRYSDGFSSDQIFKGQGYVNDN
jgi:hypothetical protein